jgi:hypothetical protein
VSGSQYVLAIDQLIDPTTAQLKPASISLSLNGICNHTHTLAIQTNRGGLQTSSGARPGFSNRVDYSASVLWGGSSSSIQTSGVAGESSPNAVMPGAFSGTLQVEIRINADGANRLPLLAGTYSDNIVITFKPQI